MSATIHLTVENRAGNPDAPAGNATVLGAPYGETVYLEFASEGEARAFIESTLTGDDEYMTSWGIQSRNDEWDITLWENTTPADAPAATAYRYPPADLLVMLTNEYARDAARALYLAEWEYELACLADSYGNIYADTRRIETAAKRLTVARANWHNCTK